MLRAIALGIISARISFCASVAPTVNAEIEAKGRAAVLAELAQGKISDIARLSTEFQREVAEACRVIKVWTIPRVAYVDADRKCIERLAASARVTAVELPARGFVVTADSVTPSRYDLVAVLGGGFDPGDTAIREFVREEACFCYANGLPCCPEGGSGQVSEYAAARPGARRTTEGTLAASARGADTDAIDGRNVRIVPVRVTNPGTETVPVESVLEALERISAHSGGISAIVFSFEQVEAHCGACDGEGVSNRALAAYVRYFRGKGMRVLAPSLGFRTRGTPGCLSGVDSFPASIEPPPGLSPPVESRGPVAGVLAAAGRAEVVLRTSTGSTTFRVLDGRSDWKGRSARGWWFQYGENPARNLFHGVETSACDPDSWGSMER